ncbi:hypothetical protein CRENPOLYSF2_4280001 [Crenothrix polyspora]|uniref:Uncharacterized protein n=1 Tax=Crenothrix polyspora TaxID=360316 RepID=A0A1R4HF29_9GAMM|nr:hypothetical protein CRENPOLYSF2_4280001 [Crenothrix polyspora]
MWVYRRTTIKLSKKSPSPAGEGWGEENKINNLNSPHPSLLTLEKGRVLNLMAVGYIGGEVKEAKRCISQRIQSNGAKQPYDGFFEPVIMF